MLLQAACNGMIRLCFQARYVAGSKSRFDGFEGVSVR